MKKINFVNKKNVKKKIVEKFFFVKKQNFVKKNNVKEKIICDKKFCEENFIFPKKIVLAKKIILDIFFS